MGFKSLLAFMCLSLAISGYAVSVEEFFKPVPNSGAKLAKDKLYPEGRVFPYAGFSAKSVEATKKDHFTVGGPAYGTKGVQMMVEQSENCGLPVLYPIHPVYKDGLLDKNILSGKEEIDWAPIVKSIKEQVKNAPKSVGWWYLTPEELRYWRKNEYKYLQLAYKTIKETDPQKRPVWMYIPGHYAEKALEKYVPYQDILGKGMYTNYSGFKTDRVWCRWTIEAEVNAIKAVPGSKCIPIAVPEMFQEPKPEEVKLIPAWVRHDTYLSLVSGAKGVVIFSLWPRAKFPSHGKYYAEYAKIAGELCGELNLGQVFLFGKKCDDIKAKITAGPSTISMQVNRKDETLPSLAWLDASLDGKRYLIAVNSANEALKVDFSGLPKAGIKVKDIIGGNVITSTSNGGFALELKPLEVKCMIFERD